MRSAPFVALLALALPATLLVGCGAKAVVLGGAPRTKQYRSIVSLSPSTSELIGALGRGDAFKGRTAACNFPEYAMRKVPVVAEVKPDYEKIATIKPDLVVYDADLYNASDAAKIKELGAEVFVMDAKNLDDYSAQVAALANMTGSETTASEYLDKVAAARSVAKASPFPRPIKIAVLMGGGGGEYYVAGTEGFLADCIKAAGGVPVGPKGSIFVKMDAEAMIAAAPDTIVVPVADKDVAAAQKALSGVLDDPRLATVPAVKLRRVIPVKTDILLRKGYRVNKLIDGLHGALAKQ